MVAAILELYLTKATLLRCVDVFKTRVNCQLLFCTNKYNISLELPEVLAIGNVRYRGTNLGIPHVCR